MADHPARSGQTAPSGCIVTVLPGGEQIPVQPGETMLEGFNRSGYSYRIGCRRGGCAFCKVDVVSGEVSHNRPVCDTVLTPEEVAAGTVLSCRAVPAGDVTIRMRDESLRLSNKMLRDLRMAAYAKAEREQSPDGPPSTTPMHDAHDQQGAIS